MTNSVTLRDVAEMAGVSIGTASQALNNRPNVASATRARVLDAALTLGYPLKDKPIAPSNGELSVIGLLIKHDFGLPPEVNPFYSYVQMGVESECRKRRISLMFANIEVDPANHPVVWPPMVSEQQVDGLILAGTFIDDTLGALRRKLDIPIVLVDSYAPMLSFDSVVIANELGAAAAVTHFIQQGHRHIALVGANAQSPPSICERRLGYCKTLENHGIHDMYIEESGLSREAGYEAAKRLLQRQPQITAMFACNDLAAMGVISAARDLSYEIPQDLSVIGFDNIDLAREITPALTTVHVHKTWLGSLGVQRLVDRVESPHQPKVTIVLDTHLVMRDSVAAL